MLTLFGGRLALCASRVVDPLLDVEEGSEVLVRAEGDVGRRRGRVAVHQTARDAGDLRKTKDEIAVIVGLQI